MVKTGFGASRAGVEKSLVLGITVVVCSALLTVAADEPNRTATVSPPTATTSPNVPSAETPSYAPGSSAETPRPYAPSAETPRSRYTSAPSAAEPEASSGADAPVPERKRVVFHLNHVPAADIATALNRLLAAEVPNPGYYDPRTQPRSAVYFVPGATSNSLLVSGPADDIDEVTELVAKLDTPLDVVTIGVCIAVTTPEVTAGKIPDELLDRLLKKEPSAKDASADDDSEDASVKKAPTLKEDGAAWLAWADKQNLLSVFSQHRLTTLDNQPARIETRSLIPTNAASAPYTDTSYERAELDLAVTPRISPEGVVTMELRVEFQTSKFGSSYVNATVSAKDGQTVVVAGCPQCVDDSVTQLIIAVTASVNPDD
ncbi:MAG TPA: secretin N-terminal domain-containing protein [Thermoguttaceae bacterium]|nr:secretin N-terminal domain-containing protein [Thermoguttaceae bacterium]